MLLKVMAVRGDSAQGHNANTPNLRPRLGEEFQHGLIFVIGSLAIPAQ